VSVFYEQLGSKLPPGTIVSVGEEKTLEKTPAGQEFQDERCYVVGENQPRDRMIHEPTPIEKAPATTTSKISGLIFNIICKSKISTSASKRSGLSPQLLLLHLHVVEGKQVRINPGSEVVAEMQLYNIRNFWFTDAQFIPPVNLLTTL